MDLKYVGWKVLVVFVSFRIGKNAGTLLTRWGNFGFHKIRGISGLTEDLVAFQ
jgi:hypothetical protein